MDKRKHSSDSGETPEAKSARNGGSPANASDSIREASAVLLDDSIQELVGITAITEQDSVNCVTCVSDTSSKDTNSKDEQVNTNSDRDISGAAAHDLSGSSEILHFLKKIDNRLENVEKKLAKLDSLDAKVSTIDSDVKKLWVYVQDNIKSSDDKVNKCMDQLDTLQFALGQANDCITRLTQQQCKMNDEMDYMRSQSMRNNLIFGNIPEAINEKWSVTETKVREFLVHDMGIQQGVADRLSIERAHRSTQPPDGVTLADYSNDTGNDADDNRPFGPPRKPRNIFVKFGSYKDRETVRSHSKNLKGTCYYVHEQFPKAVNDRRKALVPRLKEALSKGQKAWLSYDKLYIDGHVQSSDSQPDSTSRADASSSSSVYGGGASGGTSVSDGMAGSQSSENGARSGGRREGRGRNRGGGREGRGGGRGGRGGSRGGRSGRH